MALWSLQVYDLGSRVYIVPEEHFTAMAAVMSPRSNKETNPAIIHSTAIGRLNCEARHACCALPTSLPLLIAVSRCLVAQSGLTTS